MGHQQSVGTDSPPRGPDQHPPGGSVLCVLVVYGRRPDEAAAWDWLCAATDQARPPRHEAAPADGNADQTRSAGMGDRTGDHTGDHTGDRLRLDHLLVYDNSPAADWAGLATGPSLTLTHDPGNGGTVAAYRAAADLARRRGHDWVLLLDQDTHLPADYLDRLGRSLAAAGESPDALVPQVHDAGRLVSPAWCSTAVGMTPTTDLAPRDRRGFVTAISSGALLRPSVLSGAEPFAEGMWLDYVDHWIFLALARAGGRVAVADVVIDHALSVMDPGGLTTRRVDSILDGESALAARLGGRAPYLLPLRRLVRAARLARVNPAAARRVLGRILRPGPARAPNRDGRAL